MARYVTECRQCGKQAEVNDIHGLPWAWVRVSAPRWVLFRQSLEFCSMRCLAQFLLGHETEILTAGVYTDPRSREEPQKPPPPPPAYVRKG